MYMTEEKLYKSIKYLISYPDDFDAGKKYPLIVFLHGRGGISNDLGVLKSYPSFIHLDSRKNFGYVLLAPLCSVNNWNEVMPYLIDLVDCTRALDFIDTARVYVTGNSMGGYGTWELASLRPDWFAAVMPLCGGGMKWIADRYVGLPIRTFHGVRDTIVDPIESLEMVKAINRLGGNAELILFPTLEHNCWDKVYTDKDNYDWLLSFTTERSAIVEEKYPEAY